MEWKFSEEQLAYTEALRDWLEDAAPVETVRAWQAVGDSADFEAQFARDWAGVGLAEELGGQGGGLVELAQTAEELARAAAPSAAWMSTVLAAPLLAGRADLVEAALAGATLTLLVPSDAIPGSTPPLAVDAAGRITGASRACWPETPPHTSWWLFRGTGRRACGWWTPPRRASA